MVSKRANEQAICNELPEHQITPSNFPHYEREPRNTLENHRLPKYVMGINTHSSDMQGQEENHFGSNEIVRLSSSR